MPTHRKKLEKAEALELDWVWAKAPGKDREQPVAFPTVGIWSASNQSFGRNGADGQDQRKRKTAWQLFRLIGMEASLTSRLKNPRAIHFTTIWLFARSTTHRPFLPCPQVMEAENWIYLWNLNFWPALTKLMLKEGRHREGPQTSGDPWRSHHDREIASPPARNDALSSK